VPLVHVYPLAWWPRGVQFAFGYASVAPLPFVQDAWMPIPSKSPMSPGRCHLMPAPSLLIPVTDVSSQPAYQFFAGTAAAGLPLKASQPLRT
jgi:hypothetical protein